MCEYCNGETSSGDVHLTFGSGKTYIMPDMIVHYIERHGYQPPQEFIRDVMGGQLLSGERWQTRAIPERVGYLSGEYPRGDVPHLFVYVLAGMMAIAAKQGRRQQTKGM